MTNEEKDLNTATEDLQVYEIGYLLVSSVPVDKVPEEVSILKEKITQNGGIFISDQDPELITLAYSMSKVTSHKRASFDSAYFGWVKFYLKPESVEVLKNSAENSDKMLRLLIVKTEKDDALTVVKKNITPKEEENKEGEVKEVKKVEKKPINKKEIDESIEELVIS